VRRVAPLLRRLLGQALRPPLRDRRFWFVQGLVLAIAALHETADARHLLHPTGIPDFATVGLFLVPIIYAALNFGMAGSIATACLVTLVTVPDFFLVHTAEHHWIDGIQLAIIGAVAVFVGHRVEQERLAREAHRAAEARYRALFERNNNAILVVGGDDRVKECNAAASALFGTAGGRLLEDLVGPAVRRAFAEGAEAPVFRVPGAQADRSLRPQCTRLQDETGAELLQVVLQDVTEERRRHEEVAAYAGHVLQAQEDERLRVAQEIHDDPLQALMHLTRELESVAADRDTPRPLAERLEADHGLAARIAASLRDLARGLRPSSLDDLGLVPSLRRLVIDFGERNQVGATFTTSDSETRLGPAMELALFRIAQEALTNVERHSACRTTAVDLQITDAWATLKVVDDGVGFSVDPLADGSHRGQLGLVGMRERASLLAGRLAIDSEPGRGTTLEAALPRSGAWTQHSSGGGAPGEQPPQHESVTAATTPGRSSG
jgi:signal transduction histidine kinase